jgi:rRNA biogenesis protein RRP5
VNEGVDFAIKTCRKAIEVIHFRQEESRLELWKCLLNLYFFYKNEEAEFKKIFYEALAANIKKKIMDHVECICKVGERFEYGEQLLEEYLKRVDSKEDAWLKYIKYLLECKVLQMNKHQNEIKNENEDEEESESEKIESVYKDKVKSILRRSLQSIVKHKHVFFLSRYAVLEYKNEDSETGRTNFENLVSSFPNRIDIWGVYLDMEIKYYRGNLEDLRTLFDRILGLSKLKMKTAKNVFKKLLEFETKYGSKGRSKVVKQRAMEYVMSRSKTN